MNINLTGSVIFLLRTEYRIEAYYRNTTQILHISHLNRKISAEVRGDIGKKAEADEFHLWPKNHDLDLFPFNTNLLLLSLNQEQVKLKSVRSQSYFCSRFTLSSAMSSVHLYASDKTWRMFSSDLCFFYYFKSQGKTIVIWTSVFLAYSTWMACRRWEKHFISLLSVILYNIFSFLLPI